MKTRELDVWVKHHAGVKIPAVYFQGEPCPGDAIKAKLVFPAEPEVVETTWDCTDPLRYPAASHIMDKLEGRKWKAVFTELLETEK